MVGLSGRAVVTGVRTAFVIRKTTGQRLSESIPALDIRAVWGEELLMLTFKKKNRKQQLFNEQVFGKAMTFLLEIRYKNVSPTVY